MSRDELIRILQDVLSEGPRLKLAVLFGSMARGTDTARSDLDLAILPTDSELPLRDELALQARISSAAKREVDLVRLDRCTSTFRYRVAREGVPVFAEPGALSSFRARAGIEHADLAPLVKRATETFLKRVRSAPQSGGAQ